MGMLNEVVRSQTQFFPTSYSCLPIKREDKILSSIKPQISFGLSAISPTSDGPRNLSQILA